MSAILLADGSPHARCMGEKILADEGYAVVCAADGAAALKLLGDLDPDLLIAEASLAGCSGFELCRQMKARGGHTRVILTAGTLEALDQDEGRRAGCDAMIRKPFEATAFLDLVREITEKVLLAMRGR